MLRSIIAQNRAQRQEVFLDFFLWMRYNEKKLSFGSAWGGMNVDENTAQKQSWGEKPFLERLGIVLGILASIVAIIGGIYFLWDRYGPSVPVDAAEVTTVEETTSETSSAQVTTTAETTTEQITTEIIKTANATTSATKVTTTKKSTTMMKSTAKALCSKQELEQIRDWGISYAKSLGYLYYPNLVLDLRENTNSRDPVSVWLDDNLNSYKEYSTSGVHHWNQADDDREYIYSSLQAALDSEDTYNHYDTIVFTIQVVQGFRYGNNKEVYYLVYRAVKINN